MDPNPNWSVRFTEPITKLPPLFPQNIPPIPRRTMALDMDIGPPFIETSESASTFTEIVFPVEGEASQNGTSSRRLRPRRAKATTAPDTTAPAQSAGSNRSTARSKTSKKSSRAASKKKAVRKEAALAVTQTEQELVTGSPATAADSPSQAESTNNQFTI
jgi:hypothetical protein